jgi:hypothetical protein
MGRLDLGLRAPMALGPHGVIEIDGFVPLRSKVADHGGFADSRHTGEKYPLHRGSVVI